MVGKEPAIFFLTVHRLLEFLEDWAAGAVIDDYAGVVRIVSDEIWDCPCAYMRIGSLAQKQSADLAHFVALR